MQRWKIQLFYHDRPATPSIRCALCLVLAALVLCPVAVKGGSVEYSVKPLPSHVTVPVEYKPWIPERREYRDRDIVLTLASRSFSQGEAVYWELVRQGDSRAVLQSVALEGKPLRYGTLSWGSRGFFALDPDRKPGKVLFRLVFTGRDGMEYVEMLIDVHDAGFLFSRTPLDLGKYSDVDYQEKPENLEFIRICTEKKNRAFGTLGPDLVMSSLAHPRDRHYVTSSFWSRRVYMQYRYKKGKRINLPGRTKIHKGIDLRGTTGEPVFAILGGTVNLAETLFYEGNMVIVDHGNRIFTYYMHMDGVMVSSGEKVKAGDQVGRVGSTGTSTAAHLHVSMIIDGIQVDPLSILFLPVRE